jgi:hypothetical protein
MVVLTPPPTATSTPVALPGEQPGTAPAAGASPNPTIG